MREKTRGTGEEGLSRCVDPEGNRRDEEYVALRVKPEFCSPGNIIT